jgi:hypothetical protein
MGRVKPLAALSGLAGVLGSVVYDPLAVFGLVDWVVVNLDLLLPLFTTLAYRIAPHFEWIDPDWFNYGILALSSLFLLATLRKLADRTVG